MSDALDLLDDAVNVIVDQALRLLLPLVAIFLNQNFPKATRGLVWFHVRFIRADRRPVLQDRILVEFRSVELH